MLPLRVAIRLMDRSREPGLKNCTKHIFLFSEIELGTVPVVRMDGNQTVIQPPPTPDKEG